MLGFVNYKKGCTRLAAASDKVYQLLAHGQWFSAASTTTKTGRHDIGESVIKHQIKSIKYMFLHSILFEDLFVISTVALGQMKMTTGQNYNM